jgi:hypothetical protein
MLFRFLPDALVCSFGISTASFFINSSAVGKTGAACANSGKTTNLTGKKGALPATAESIIERMRSVLRRISRRSTGFGWSVWQAAAEYLMWCIKFNVRITNFKYELIVSYCVFI